MPTSAARVTTALSTPHGRTTLTCRPNQPDRYWYRHLSRLVPVPGPSRGGADVALPLQGECVALGHVYEHT